MSEKDYRIFCGERGCDFKGRISDLLIAENPFDNSQSVYGCPECKEIDTTVVACEIDGCWNETTCGLNTEDGYKRLCSKHGQPYLNKMK